jgi:LmbE family N-acetylglucosaminyl deacetylase
VFLFRLLKADTILSFNPSGHDEENPDHWVTGRAVEEACWMSEMGNDYPEHLEAGVKPHGVKERYYFVGRPGQPFNRVVDISSTIDVKIAALTECKTQGGGNGGSLLRARLAREGRRLPMLGGDNQTADREYVRQFLIGEYKTLGEQYSCAYAEAFYYLDHRVLKTQTEVDDYIKDNAVPL